MISPIPPILILYVFPSPLADQMDPLPEPSGSVTKRPTAAYSSLPELAGPLYVPPEDRSYRHQYANIYFVRLVELRPVVEQTAMERWGRVRGQLLGILLLTYGHTKLTVQVNHHCYPGF